MTEELPVRQSETSPLPSRLVKWVNERPPVSLFSEWNARRTIAQEVGLDMIKPVSGDEVYNRLQPLLGELDKTAELSGGYPLVVHKNDSKTRVPYSVVIRKDGDQTYIAEEVRGDKTVISRSSISPKLSEITLSFPEYGSGDPNIDRQPLSRAAEQVFRLLSGSVVQTKNSPKFR